MLKLISLLTLSTISVYQRFITLVRRSYLRPRCLKIFLKFLSTSSSTIFLVLLKIKVYLLGVSNIQRQITTIKHRWRYTLQFYFYKQYLINTTRNHKIWVIKKQWDTHTRTHTHTHTHTHTCARAYAADNYR